MVKKLHKFQLDECIQLYYWKMDSYIHGDVVTMVLLVMAPTLIFGAFGMATALAAILRVVIG